MAQWHVVKRPFDGPDGRLLPGELVDASGWKHLDKLVSQLYLRTATPQEVETAVFVDEVPKPPRKQNKR